MFRYNSVVSSFTKCNNLLNGSRCRSRFHMFHIPKRCNSSEYDTRQWKTHINTKLSGLVSKKDFDGILSELKKVSKEHLNGKISNSEIGVAAANICIDDGIINYGLGCDMFDALNSIDPEISVAGYRKLLDLCVLLDSSHALINVHGRLVDQGVTVAYETQLKLVKFLIQKGEVLKAVNLAMTFKDVTSELLVLLAEPLFLLGHWDTFTTLLTAFAERSIPPSPQQISRILVAVIWARSRCGSNRLPADPLVLKQLVELTDVMTTRCIPTAHSSALRDIGLFRDALGSAFSEEPIYGRTLETQCRLQWRFVSEPDYNPFPFLSCDHTPTETRSGEGPSTVEGEQLNDLTSQLVAASWSRKASGRPPMEAANVQPVLFCRSLWPDQYSREVRELAGMDRSEEFNSDDDYDSDEDEDEDDGYDSDGLETGVEYTNLEKGSQSSGVGKSPILATRKPIAVPGREDGKKSGQVHHLASSENKIVRGIVSALFHGAVTADGDGDGDGTDKSRNDEDSLSDEDDLKDLDTSSDSETSNDSDVDELLDAVNAEEDSDSDSDSDSDEENDEEEDVVQLRTSDSRALLRRLNSLGSEPVSVRNIPGLKPLDLTAQLAGFYRGEPLGTMAKEGRNSVIASSMSLAPSPAPLLYASDLFGENTSVAAFVREQRRGSAREGLEALERHAFSGTLPLEDSSRSK